MIITSGSPDAHTLAARLKDDAEPYIIAWAARMISSKASVGEVALYLSSRRLTGPVSYHTVLQSGWPQLRKKPLELDSISQPISYAKDKATSSLSINV